MADRETRRLSSLASNEPQPDLDALIARARNRHEDPRGVEAAVVALMGRFRSTLVAAVRTCMWGGVGEEDLLQEACVGLLRAVDTYDPTKGPFASWLWIWARNACSKAGREAILVRDITVAGSVEDGLDHHYLADPSGGVEETVIETIERRRRSEALERLVAGLPEDVRRGSMRRDGAGLGQRRRAMAMLRHPSARSTLLDMVEPDRSAKAATQVAGSVSRLPSGLEEIAKVLADQPVADPRGQWLRSASCGGMAVETFFSAVSRGVAATTCRRCPVEVECLLDAITLPDRGGLRAGTVERQRRVIKRLVRQLRAGISTDDSVNTDPR